jgi:H+/Cl- antiporter ClcA
MLDRFGTNPTQLLGILSFSLTTLACSLAALRSPDARIWKVLTFVNALFIVEIIVGFRFRILDWARALLQDRGEYRQLHGKDQGMAIVALVAAAAIAMLLFLLLRRVARPAARVGASLTIVLLALFAIETISLHEIDAIFYLRIGPVLLVGWLWGVASAGICLAALNSRPKRPEP